MDGIITKKQNFAYKLLIFATFFLYIVLTGAKNLYVAEKTTLEGLGTFGSFTDLAATMEYYFYSYAAMQIFLAFFIKKLNIKWFLTVTLSISAIITILMAFTDTIISHWILYTVNGAMQAGVWSCSLKVLGLYLPKNLLATANKVMGASPAVAGIVSYGTAALFGNNWTLPFIFLGVLLLLSIALYFFSVTMVQRFPRVVETHHVVHANGTEEDVSEDEENDFIHLINKKRVVVFFIISILMDVMVTALFYTINNTLDIFLKQVGNFGNTTAKLITILAPVATIAGPILCVNACEKERNFIKVGTGFFALTLVFSTALLFFFDVNIILSMFFILMFLILANGGRSICLTIAPLKMRDKIDTGMYSALTNAAASISTGIMPKLFTSIIDNPLLSIHKNWTNAFTLMVLWNLLVVAILVGLILWVKVLNKKDRLNESPIVSDTISEE